MAQSSSSGGKKTVSGKKWVYSCDKCTKFYVGESAGSSLRCHKYRKHSLRARRIFTATEVMDRELPSSQRNRHPTTVTSEAGGDASTSVTAMMEDTDDPMLDVSPGSIADLTRILQDLPDLGTISTTPLWDEYFSPDVPTLEDIIDVDALFAGGPPTELPDLGGSVLDEFPEIRDIYGLSKPILREVVHQAKTVGTDYEQFLAESRFYVPRMPTLGLRSRLGRTTA